MGKLNIQYWFMAILMGLSACSFTDDGLLSDDKEQHTGVTVETENVISMVSLSDGSPASGAVVELYSHDSSGSDDDAASLAKVSNTISAAGVLVYTTLVDAQGNFKLEYNVGESYTIEITYQSNNTYGFFSFQFVGGDSSKAELERFIISDFKFDLDSTDLGEEFIEELDKLVEVSFPQVYVESDEFDTVLNPNIKINPEEDVWVKGTYSMTVIHPSLEDGEDEFEFTIDGEGHIEIEDPENLDYLYWLCEIYAYTMTYFEECHEDDFDDLKDDEEFEEDKKSIDVEKSIEINS